MATHTVALSDNSAILVEAQGNVFYKGFTVRETTGVAFAKFNVRENDGSGLILDCVNLAPGESCREFYDYTAKKCNGDLYLELLEGQFEGTIFYAD